MPLLLMLMAPNRHSTLTITGGDAVVGQHHHHNNNNRQHQQQQQQQNSSTTSSSTSLSSTSTQIAANQATNKNNNNNNSPSTATASTQTNTEPPHKPWYQAFIQRYLRRKSQPSSSSSTLTSSSLHQHHHFRVNRKTQASLQVEQQQPPMTSQSAPATPVKWIEAKQCATELIEPLESLRESLEVESSLTNDLGVSPPGGDSSRLNPSRQLRPSVRFACDASNNEPPPPPPHIEACLVHEPAGACGGAGQLDDEHDEADELGEELEEDGLEEEEVGGALDDDEGGKRASELVAKLFEFPTLDEDKICNMLSGNKGVDILRAADNKTSSHQEVDDKITPSENSEASSKQTELIKGECPMDSNHFRHYGYRLIDYICNYLDTIKDRRVTPLNIEPGYLKSLIEPAAPAQGEPFPKIMQDFEQHIMCGITHWQHPHFHAYFPAGNAYPSILADMLSDALGCMGFSWAASPAYTELEIIMLDWMGKMIGLPDEFLCLSGSQESRGGGVIQGSASECVLVNLLAARHWAIERLRAKYPRVADGILLSKLIGYCSKEAHSCVEKAAMIGFIRMRALEPDENQSLRGETLARAIEADLAQGLEPFLVCATLGTTSCVSFDNLDELGTVCEKHDIWLHVDAAYAGSALICPEFKYLMRGIEKASSFNMNPNKWLLINFDCSLMWVRDRFKLTRAFVVDPLYLQHSYSDQAIDYRHWGIPLSRRFRALKLWFVIRNYGITGLQEYVRNHVRLAKLFESLIRADSRFMVTNQVVLGLVCFRLVGTNALNQRLLSIINASGKLHMVPASVNGRYVIRFCVCDQNAKEEDVRYAYECIAEFARELLESVEAGKERFRAISAQNTVEMLASTLPIGEQEQQDDSAGATSSGGEQANASELEEASSVNRSRVPSRLSERSVSMDSSTGGAGGRPATVLSMAGDQSPSSLSSPRRIDSGRSSSTAPTQSPPVTGGAISPARSQDNSRLSVGGANSSCSKSPLTKQRSMLLANDSSIAEPSADSLEIQSPKSATEGDQQAPSESEQFKTAQRRARVTSGRYKRKFFVRVVSDPRVYRASISGDINAHSSSGSLAGNGSLISNGSQLSMSGDQATLAPATPTNSNKTTTTSLNQPATIITHNANNKSTASNNN